MGGTGVAVAVTVAAGVSVCPATGVDVGIETVITAWLDSDDFSVGVPQLAVLKRAPITARFNRAKVFLCIVPLNDQRAPEIADHGAVPRTPLSWMIPERNLRCLPAKRSDIAFAHLSGYLFLCP